jgi:glycine dehydrogenase subunit 1
MYDGATACAEALMMAERVTGRRRSLLSRGLHPHYADTVFTYLRSEHGHVATEYAPFIDFGKDGRIDRASLGQALERGDVGCVVVQSPNFFGVVEDLAALATLAHAHGALLVVATAEPLAYGVLAAPGTLGADIAVGEGMGLAVPPQMGGPGVGLFAARAEMVRQMPGRLCGETVDKDGRRGYVLTLATREQHIRREKATSNICTNQGLIALAFAIHLGILGKRGFVELARLNLAKAEFGKKLLTSVAGVSLAFSGPTFNELSLRLPRKASDVVARLAERGIYGGVSARGAGLYGVPPAGMTAVDENILVLSVTELHDKADLERYAKTLAEVLS